PLRVIVPPRNLMNADADRPVVGGNHETSQRAVDAIFNALAPALPDRVTASGPTTSGVLIFGARTPDGRWTIFYETHGGGEGAGDVGGRGGLRLTGGARVLIETCGGGGFGPPAERPAEAREADRREGYV